MLRKFALFALVTMLPSLAAAAPAPRHRDLSVLREVATQSARWWR